MSTAAYNHIPLSGYAPQTGVTQVENHDLDTYIDQRPRHIIHLEGFLAIFEDIKFIFEMIIEVIKDLFRAKDAKNTYNQESFDKSDNHQVFFIPGLGDPGIWGQMAKRELQNQNPNINVCVCQNKNNGNQDITETFNALYKQVHEYCLKNPGKPVVLAGVSLGGFMTHAIENALRKDHPNTAVFIYAMAPAFTSKFCSFMNEKVPSLTKKILHESLIDLFKVGGKITKRLIDSENKPLNHVAERLIIDVLASNDDLIKESDAFPKLKNQPKLLNIRQVAHKCSHLGILSVCRQDMQKNILEFFKHFPPQNQSTGD